LEWETEMSAEDDSVQGYALGAVGGVVGLVLAGVIALACAKGLQSTATPSAATQRVFFGATEDALSAEADEVLGRLADAARRDERVVVLITGVRDAGGDTAAAQRRALRVRHALEANGVPPAQLVLGQPLAVPRRGGDKQARRVDITLQ
jgi:outer membrane protein OmpA-like peptidoglycan-associated protein